MVPGPFPAAATHREWDERIASFVTQLLHLQISQSSCATAYAEKPCHSLIHITMFGRHVFNGAKFYICTAACLYNLSNSLRLLIKFYKIFTIANVLSRTHVLVIAMVASKMAKSDKFTTGDKSSPQLGCQRACTICMGSKSLSVNHRP